jgi:hypothetical protein
MTHHNFRPKRALEGRNMGGIAAWFVAALFLGILAVTINVVLSLFRWFSISKIRETSSLVGLLQAFSPHTVLLCEDNTIYAVHRSGRYGVRLFLHYNLLTWQGSPRAVHEFMTAAQKSRRVRIGVWWIVTVAIAAWIAFITILASHAPAGWRHAFDANAFPTNSPAGLAVTSYFFAALFAFHTLVPFSIWIWPSLAGEIANAAAESLMEGLSDAAEGANETLIGGKGAFLEGAGAADHATEQEKLIRELLENGQNDDALDVADRLLSKNIESLRRSAWATPLVASALYWKAVVVATLGQVTDARRLTAEAVAILQPLAEMLPGLIGPQLNNLLEACSILESTPSTPG